MTLCRSYCFLRTLIEGSHNIWENCLQASILFEFYNPLPFCRLFSGDSFSIARVHRLQSYKKIAHEVLCVHLASIWTKTCTKTECHIAFLLKYLHFHKCLNLIPLFIVRSNMQTGHIPLLLIAAAHGYIQPIWHRCWCEPNGVESNCYNPSLTTQINKLECRNIQAFQNSKLSDTDMPRRQIGPIR